MVVDLARFRYRTTMVFTSKFSSLSRAVVRSKIRIISQYPTLLNLGKLCLLGHGMFMKQKNVLNITDHSQVQQSGK
jgi:hypothetical protein